MGELKNRFSWSTKRGNVFEECRRRYWFEYYGGWGGWNRRADDRTRSIYVLKQLKGRQAWAGSHVHDAAESALQLIHANLPVQPEELIEEVISKMRLEFRESKDGKYWDRPKKACGLLEHEFDLPVTDADWQENREKVKSCIRNFFESGIVKELRGLDRSQWLEVEELESFPILDIPVWVKLDLAYKPSADALRIVDWKTGRLDRNPDPIQLTCYSIYAMGKWGVPADAIETVHVNLAQNETVSRKVDEKLIGEIRGRIETSIRSMGEYLDGSLLSNEAKPESAFPVTESTASCRRCNFRKHCPDSPLNRA